MTRPLALQLPLRGRQWIEASAGTGKTFTLSLLVLRLLLEREIQLPNILAVTFTNAATQELKIKIRARIKLAQDLLKRGVSDNPADYDAKEAATVSILQSVLQEKPESKIRQMLELAIQDCDRASIFTIHGFCTRVLGDHALNAGQVLQAPALLTSNAGLNTKIAFDLWREFNGDHKLMRSLTSLWSGPELLAKQCDQLLNAKNLLPAIPEQLPSPFDMSALNRDLRSAFELELAASKQAMQQAIAAGILFKKEMSPEKIQWQFENLEKWYQLDAEQNFDDPDFLRLSTSYIIGKTKKEFRSEVPASPLFDAIDAWYQGFRQVQAFEEGQAIRCLHLVRERLANRREIMLQKMQQYTYDDLISQVVGALESESGAGLCQSLREQYQVALVDEFQDTDEQQWKIFSTLYPEKNTEHALYLIGDPKQAIYGFRGGDVHAYLAAKRETETHWDLPENFRSRPGLLGSIATIFKQGGDQAFREQDIAFYPVRPGGVVQESDFLWHGKPAPEMQFSLLPEYFDQKKKAAALPAEKARELATRACVEKIHEVLIDGQQNTAMLKDKDEMRGVQPGDIAVLVNQNKEALQVQQALSDCGIASVVSSQENLFATPQAQEIFVILDALVRHQDQARWRGALSTLLLGYTAEQILLLDTDDQLANQSADIAIAHRDLWLQQGVLSVVTQLCASAAARILALSDGERRLSNYLQLAETLQQQSALTLGPEQCLRWLGHAMQEAAVDEENTMRLDSDRKRVRILTLHKSKGLEFPLVFMPFANFGKMHKAGSGVDLLSYHRDHQRMTHAMVYGEDKKKFVETIKDFAAREQLAEQVRLLYVGLTRAQYYCWVCCGQVFQANNSGLSSLLFRNEKDEIKIPDYAGFLSKLESIGRENPSVRIEKLSYAKKELPQFRQASGFEKIEITRPATHLQFDWRVLSFSQLTHGTHHQTPTVSPAADETPSSGMPLQPIEEVFDKRFAGIAFGNALHQVLENARIDIWREHADAMTVPDGELPMLQQALLRQAYSQDDLADGVLQLTPLVFNTLRTGMPEGVRLCDLPENARLNEMEFHFSLRDCETEKLLALLKQYGVLQDREEFPFIGHLRGLMTGKVDLIYQYENRFYICDYKSNRLPAYDVETCRQAMRDSEYDFQALIYTLALHRWCKFRLQSNYDYEKHIGGIRYLFCRGLDADNENGDGIVAMRFDRQLIDALEMLLHPVQEVAA